MTEGLPGGCVCWLSRESRGCRVSRMHCCTAGENERVCHPHGSSLPASLLACTGLSWVQPTVYSVSSEATGVTDSASETRGNMLLSIFSSRSACTWPNHCFFFFLMKCIFFSTLGSFVIHVYRFSIHFLGLESCLPVFSSDFKE